MSPDDLYTAVSALPLERGDLPHCRCSWCRLRDMVEVFGNADKRPFADLLVRWYWFDSGLNPNSPCQCISCQLRWVLSVYTNSHPIGKPDVLELALFDE